MAGVNMLLSAPHWLAPYLMVVVSHDDGDKRQSTKQCESGIDIDCGCGGGKQRLAA